MDGIKEYWFFHHRNRWVLAERNAKRAMLWRSAGVEAAWRRRANWHYAQMVRITMGWLRATHHASRRQEHPRRVDRA